MKKVFFDESFDVDDATYKINSVMSRWAVHFLDINGPDWVIYDYGGDVKYLFHFQLDFNDLEMRIKLEDLKLNVIHHIESLKDETSYRDNLANPDFIK